MTSLSWQTPYTVLVSLLRTALSFDMAKRKFMIPGTAKSVNIQAERWHSSIWAVPLLNLYGTIAQFRKRSIVALLFFHKRLSRTREHTKQYGKHCSHGFLPRIHTFSHLFSCLASSLVVCDLILVSQIAFRLSESQHFTLQQRKQSKSCPILFTA